MTRTETINAILAIARKPVPEIAECGQLLGTDGRWHTAMGFPLGVRMTEPVQRRIVGYAYRGPDGCTYGTRGQSPAELQARWEAGQDRNAADFRTALEESTDQRLAEQAAYWLKGVA